MIKRLHQHNGTRSLLGFVPFDELKCYLPYLPFIALALAALGQLCQIFILRMAYPLDLEWMEGGTLIHALRLMDGRPIYEQPSVEFVSFLYTPGYPAVLALLGGIFGLTYFLGRFVSVISFSVACFFAVLWVHSAARVYEDNRLRSLAWAAGLSACASVAMAFPFCGQWFDLVRADSLWLALVVSGTYLLRPGAWGLAPGRSTEGRSFSGASAPDPSAPDPSEPRDLGVSDSRNGDRRSLLKNGNIRVVLGALLLTGAFFTKQTAVPFIVATAVAMALTAPWKKTVLFICCTSLLVVGFVLFGQKITGGWFWIYIYRLHQSHEFLWDRFWPETPEKLLLWGLPVWALAAAWPVSAALGRWVSKEGLYLFLMMGCGLAVAVVGSATQGAYDNAYIPAVFFGSLMAAVAAVDAAGLWGGGRREPGSGFSLSLRRSAFQQDDSINRSSSTRPQDHSPGCHHQHSPYQKTKPSWKGPVLGLAGLGFLAGQVVSTWFAPSATVPSVEHMRESRRFISYLKAQGTDVFVPYHPYYNVIAGGRGHLHIMGVNDAYTWAENITGDAERDREIKKRFMDSLRESFIHRRWSTVIHDRTFTHQLPGLRRSYRRGEDLVDKKMAPPMISGNACRPRYIWMPR